VIDFQALDHPIWHALTTEHRHLARANGLARRYAAEVSPLAALQKPSRAAFADLCDLVEPGEGVGLFTSEPLEVPGEWEVVRARPMEQMVCTRSAPAPSSSLISLGQADVSEMLALAAATEPDPSAGHHPNGTLFRHSFAQRTADRHGRRTAEADRLYRDQLPCVPPWAFGARDTRRDW